MEPERFILRPDLTPMENLWEAIRKATECLIASKHLRITDDEYHELKYNLMVSTFFRFKRRVLAGLYRREYPLFTNVYGCCWGCWSHNWRRISMDIKRRINQVSLDRDYGDEPGTTPYEIIPDTPERKLNYRRQHVDPDEDKLFLPTSRDQAYDRYCETCYELGIEALSLPDFVEANGGRRHWADPDWSDYKWKLESARDKRALARAMREEERIAADKIRARYAKTSELTSQSST